MCSHIAYLRYRSSVVSTQFEEVPVLYSRVAQNNTNPPNDELRQLHTCSLVPVTHSERERRRYLNSLNGVVVITCPSHGQGPGFDPRFELSFAYFMLMSMSVNLQHNTEDKAPGY